MDSFEEAGADSRLMNDLGTDSLDTMELVVVLEEKFGVQISDEEAGKFKTIADMIKYIKKVLIF